MTAGRMSVLYKAIIIVSIAVFSLALRMYSLNSDPPDYLSWSAAIYVDEGYKALDARNILKYGAPRWSEHDSYRGHRDESPVIHAVQLWIFETFGIKIINLRYFNIAVSVGIIVLTLFVLSFFFNKRTIFLLGLAMSINVILLFHSRIALYELPMVFLCVLLFLPMFFYLSRMGQIDRAGHILFVFALSLVVVLVSWLGMRIKGSFAIYIGSVLAAFAFAAILPFFKKRTRYPRILDPKNLFLMAIGGILLVSFILYVWQANLGFQVRYLGNPFILLGKIWFLEIIYLQPNTFLMAVLCTIAVIKILGNRRYFSYNRERFLQYQIDVFFALQFIFSFLVVYMSSYSPLRYFLFSEVSILFLAGRFVANYDGEIKILNEGRKRPKSAARSLIIFVLMFYIAIQFVIFLVMLFLSYETRKVIFDDFYLNLTKGVLAGPGASFVFILIAVVLPLVFYLAKNYDDFVAFIQKHITPKMMIFLLIEVQLIYLLSWQFNRTTTIRDAMDFVNTLPAGSVMIGDWAPMLCFESDLKPIYSNPDDRRNVGNIPLLRPDYVVVKSHKNEEAKYNEYVPGLIEPDNFIYGFKVQAFDIKIYRVDKYAKKPRAP
ncbi:MAG TPA: hypothetical protein VLM75_02550 [Spirochaetota bacterium]|nr:hypothetical protein [Spirochaetota bacterium]